MRKRILQQIETIKVIRQTVFTEEERKNKERTARRGHKVSPQYFALLLTIPIPLKYKCCYPVYYNIGLKIAQV